MKKLRITNEFPKENPQEEKEKTSACFGTLLYDVHLHRG